MRQRLVKSGRVVRERLLQYFASVGVVRERLFQYFASLAGVT